ncbi:MAG: hypothetical protein AABO58_08355 [Acidobacteriota bacterium]
MTGDIRSSTFIMKESIDFRQFATLVNVLVATVSKNLRRYRGWFDKFTGDGFLAYWVLGDRHETDYLAEVVSMSRVIVNAFTDKVEPGLRRNARNFPERSGLSIGLDSGPGYFAEVAGQLTVVGPPVVGAVRMVGAAEPREIIANVHIGERWLETPDLLRETDVEIIADVRATKEYPKGQVVYKIAKPTLSSQALAG